MEVYQGCQGAQIDGKVADGDEAVHMLALRQHSAVRSGKTRHKRLAVLPPLPLPPVPLTG